MKKVSLLFLLCLTTLLKAEDPKIESALKANDAPALAVAFKNGSNANAADAAGTPYVLNAAYTPALLSEFIKAGVNVNVTTSYGYTPLMNAVALGCSECVAMLIKAGADVNLQTKPGNNTALILASNQNCAQCVKLLVDAGADVNAVNDLGQSPIMQAASSFTPQVRAQNVSFMVDAVSKGGYTALIPDAYINPDPSHWDDAGKTVKILMDNGANLKIKNPLKITPLMAAAEKNSSEAMAILIANGAKLKDKDSDGQTAWEYAIKGQAGNSMAFMVKEGYVKVNQGFDWHDFQTGTDMKDMTALAVAARTGTPESIKTLLELGADCSAASKGKELFTGGYCMLELKNKGVFVYAVESGKLENVKTIVETCGVQECWAGWNRYMIVPVPLPGVDKTKIKAHGGPCNVWANNKGKPWEYARELGYENIAAYLEKEFYAVTLGKKY